MSGRAISVCVTAGGRVRAGAVVGLLVFGVAACGRHPALAPGDTARRAHPAAGASSPPGTDDPHGPYARETGLDPYAAAIERAAGGRHADPVGYCSVGIDPTHNGVYVWWHGPTPTPAVTTVLDRARRHGIRVTVHHARYDKHQLGPIEDRLVARMISLHINALSIAPNCSAITIGLTDPTPADEAPIRAVAGPAAPVTFTTASPVMPEVRDLSTATPTRTG